MFKTFTLWLEDNKKGIFLLGTVSVFTLIVLISLSLLISYWLMGIYPKVYEFPMQIGVSCVGAVAATIPILWALYKSLTEDKKAETERYKMDSMFNSPKGEQIRKGIGDR